MDKKKSITHQQMNNQNWRYKKKTPPTDEFADKNGVVKVTKLPDPFKCSKCSYIFKNIQDKNVHWLDEH